MDVGRWLTEWAAGRRALMTGLKRAGIRAIDAAQGGG
jgi:hypothetical protein